ncbi:hypothetical protein [Sphingomonas sp. CFBP 13733]|uniref:hypothetical protein n=1 Tax=Sphingomonas sp. CFBP 13733 TaxID=2775291 RepID=UPI0017800CC3|nr:hypothetical protein [Sphingomonas sp. CFBP 13733]MBD8640277.1 hypothetical protein [Sphingomonas sp. CFBP 13733]
MSLFDYLQAFDADELAMPLMHSTATAIGARIIVQGELRTRGCRVYGTDLLYLFYGRPAFKPLPGAAPSGIAEHLPMCLVLDPALLGDALRILPFDSGGYGRYAPHIGPLLDRPDFELGPRGDLPMRLVRAFFDSNGNYYRARPTAHADGISFAHEAARAFARLSRDQSIADDDDRRSTIEVQIARSVPLAGALRAVVAPASLLSDPVIATALAAMPNAVPISYETYGRHQPSAYTGLLYDHVARYLVSQKVMS